MPLSPVVPILSALACLYLMLNLSVETWIRFLAWLVDRPGRLRGYGYRHSRVGRRSAADRHPSASLPPSARLTYRGTDAS